MPGSLLPMLTTATAVLLVPASAALLGAGQHAHMAPVTESARRARLGWAASLVGLGGLGTTVLLGADAATGSLVAVLLVGALLVWWRLTRSWAVRGVVVWALLVAGAVGLLGWLAERLVASSSSVAGMVAGSAGWLVLALAFARLLGHVRERIARRAQRHGSGSSESTPARRLPWLPSVLALAGATLVVAVVGGGIGGGEHSEAGRTSGERPTSTPSADRSTTSGSGSRSSRDASPDGPRRARRTAVPAGAGSSAVPRPSTTAPATSEAPAPAAPASPQTSKTPGYEKDHPNRPDHAGSPGPGRPRGR